MLFFNDSDVPLTEKIKGAKERFNCKYSSKFGLCNTCYVNSLMIKEEAVIEGIRIKISKQVMKNYFWIGNNGYTSTD